MARASDPGPRGQPSGRRPAKRNQTRLLVVAIVLLVLAAIIYVAWRKSRPEIVGGIEMTPKMKELAEQFKKELEAKIERGEAFGRFPGGTPAAPRRPGGVQPEGR